MKANIDCKNLRNSALLKTSIAGKSIPTTNAIEKTGTAPFNKIKANRQTTFFENYSLNNNSSKFANEAAMFEYLQKKARDFDEKRFLLLEILGKGGFGQVYKAYDKKRMKCVAIKDIKISNHINDKKNLDGILHEQLILKEIRNIESDRFLKFYHIYLRKIKNLSIYSIVMENGISDFKTICKLRRENNDEYTEEEYSFILYKLCGQLKILESRGISQRDIKPQNLILTHDEQENFVYKLIDFGAGYMTQKQKEKLIPMESLIGLSPYYASPEVKNREMYLYNPYQADVYSLGKSFLEMMAKEGHGIKEKLKFVKNKFKNLGPIIQEMVHEEFTSRPNFSKLKSILKNFKKIQPKENSYTKEIEKQIKSQDNDLNSIVVKMQLFLELDNKICKEYCQLAIEKVKDEKINCESRQKACINIASYYVTQNEFKSALPFLRLGQELELKSKGKNRFSTIHIILNVYLTLGEMSQVEKYLDLYLAKNPNKKKLAILLDWIFPIYIIKDINKAKSLCLKSLEIKKKIYSQSNEATIFLVNYLYLSLINIFNSKIDKDLIEKIKEMVLDLRNKQNNMFFFLHAPNYYCVLHAYFIQEDLLEEIPPLYEDMRKDIIKCSKIMGDDNQLTQNLIFMRNVLNMKDSDGDAKEAENLIGSFKNKAVEKFPIAKEFFTFDSKEKSELEVVLDNKLNKFIGKINNECCICENNDFAIKLNCNDSFCLPCIEEVVKQQMKDVDSKVVFFFECPNANCHCPISNFCLQKISKEVYEFFLNYQKNICLQNEKIAICPNNACVCFVDNETKFFPCCNNSFCSDCLKNENQHKEVTCEQANQ